MNDLRDLLLWEGRELFNSNQQELRELPKIERRAVSTDLKNLIKKQFERTEKEQKYLESAFTKLHADHDGKTCRATEAILKETHEMLENSLDRELVDAGIIRSLQMLGHRKIAGFGTSAAYARAIGEESAASYFHNALEEEKKLDVEFSRLAEQACNKFAVHS